MIQRIQTIWLLLAAAAAFLTLRFSFYSGNKPAATGLQSLTAQSDILLTILSVAVGLGALICIFLYKNRKQQFRVVILTLVVSVVNLVLYFLAIREFAEGNYDLTSIFAFAIPILLILALRGIRRDEKLVRSLNRLR